MHSTFRLVRTETVLHLTQIMIQKGY